MRIHEHELYAFRRNLVVAASAGTGKTHRLTALYVLLTLGLTSMGQTSTDRAHAPILPEQIVATTFSRAAALEIRARVEHALRALAQGEPNAPFRLEIEQRLSELCDAPSTGELRARAQAAVQSLSRARIDTLHGLASEILRKHAVPLGLPPGLRVLTEDETLSLGAGVIDEVLSLALEAGAEERSAARDLVDACGGAFALKSAVLTFLDRIDDDGLEIASLSTFDHRAHARALRRELSLAVRGAARARKRATQDLAAAVAHVLGSLSPDAPLDDATRAALSALVEQAKPKDPTDDEAIWFTFRDRLPGLTHKQRAERLLATFDEAHVTEARERAVRALLARMAERLGDERRARGVASFGDLLRLSRNRLRDRPRVLAAIQEEMRVLMVDEFQDTSRVQRDLVFLLRGESPEDRPEGQVPRAEELIDHGLFLVGDRKQSIYGFRGADVAVFNEVCSDLAGVAAEDALGLVRSGPHQRENADFLALNRSYRSRAEVVTFVNTFAALDFQEASSADQQTSVRYGEAEQLVPVDGAVGGRVLLLRDDQSALEEPLLAGAPAAVREAFAAAALVATLRREQPSLALRDVAILARRRASIPLLELALSRLELPYVVAGRALFDALEVRDVAALLTLVLEPEDRTALAHVLRGPLVALSDAALVSLCDAGGLPTDLLSRAKPSRGHTFSAAEAQRLSRFVATFVRERAALLRMPAPDAIQHAVRVFELDRVLAASPRAHARLGNVDRLAKLAHERGDGLFGFARWLARQIDDEQDEQEAVVFSEQDEAIRVTTIHASKGLDFEVTILLDLGQRERPIRPALSVAHSADSPFLSVALTDASGVRLMNPLRAAADRESTGRARSERSRISYVAVTRAKRVLGLVGSAASPEGSVMGVVEKHREQLTPLVTELSSAELIRTALSSVERAAAASPARGPTLPTKRVLPVVSTLSIATTPLGVFAGCPRRFRFRFLLGLEEPIDSGQLDLFELDMNQLERRLEPFETEAGDPREAGRAAHRVLERLSRSGFRGSASSDELHELLLKEGLGVAAAQALAPGLGAFVASDYVRGLSGAQLVAEHELRHDVPPQTPLAPTLRLRGTVDLLVERGSQLDVIDYKLARPGPLDRYAFQLRSYAAAARASSPHCRVRAGVVFLGGGGEPVWLAGQANDGALSSDDHQDTERELAALALALATARRDGRFEGVEPGTCRRLHCGFLAACHPRATDRKVGRQRAR